MDQPISVLLVSFVLVVQSGICSAFVDFASTRGGAFSFRNLSFLCIFLCRHWGLEFGRLKPTPKLSFWGFGGLMLNF